MLIGQTVTNIMPDFAFKRNVGLLGKIVDNPFLDICRSQIDISFDCDSKLVAETDAWLSLDNCIWGLFE